MATSSSSTAAPPRRDGEYSSNTPTAKFLQARIDTLRNTLVSRLENIFAAAIDDTASATDDQLPAPPLTDTAAKQLQIDVESTALIRAAEEIMLLTRTMKELWLFGGLDTIVNEEDPVQAEKRAQLKKDEKEVVRGLMEFLERTDGYYSMSGRKDAEGRNEEEDVKMED